MYTPRKWQCTSSKQNDLTQARLKYVDFKEVQILKIVSVLNIKKKHGYDYIFIRMIKICDKSLLKPLIILSENSIQSSCYPDISKRSNIIPAHKKTDTQLVNDYRSMSLLPIFDEIFEKLYSIKPIIFCWRRVC